MGVCGSDAGEGGGSVLPGVGLDRTKGRRWPIGIRMLRESATGEVNRGCTRWFAVRVARGQWAGRGRMLDDATEGRFAVVRVVWARSFGPVRRWCGGAVLEFLTEVKPHGGS